MADAFGPRLLDASARWDAPAPDLGRIKRRGRKLRQRRLAGVAATCLVLVGAVGWGVSAVAPISGSSDQPEITTPDQRAIGGSFGAATVEGSDTDAAATFAIRSVAEAGLIDPLGRTWDYLGIEADDGNFTTTFEIIDCRPAAERPSNELEICLRSGQTVEVTVDLEGSEFEVTDVSGNTLADEQARLLGARSERVEEPPHFEDLSVRMSSLGGEPVAFGWALWTGPIPAPDLFVGCAVKYFDAAGDLIHRTRTVERQLSDGGERLDPFSGEASRDGNTPWMSEGPPEAGDLTDARFSCATYRWTQGPKLADLASNGYRVTDLKVDYTAPVYGADAPALIRIGYNAGWDSADFPGARRCVWRLWDDGGGEIAKEENQFYRLEPGFPESSGTYNTFEVRELPAGVSLECGPRIDDPTVAHNAYIEAFRPAGDELVVSWGDRWPGEGTTGTSDCTFRFEDSSGNVHTAVELVSGAGKGSTEDQPFRLPEDMDPAEIVDVSISCLPHLPEGND